jgi:thiamine phosphate synthase YjbQ (UPF0047 family)
MATLTPTAGRCYSTPAATVPVADGRLDLGTWQAVLFVDWDGP